MATVGGSRSLQGGSEETFNTVCGPCRSGNTEREAKYLCENCKEYLCDACKIYHENLTATKNHKILSGILITQVTQRNNHKILCSCNQRQEVTTYCETHEDVICNLCGSVKHRKCNTSPLREKSKEYKATDINLLMLKMRRMKNEIGKVRKELAMDHYHIDNLTKACRADIRAFRKELNAFLDKLERNILKELDEKHTKLAMTIDKQMSTVAKMTLMLEGDNKLLEDVNRSDRKDTMFASSVYVSKALKAYDSALSKLDEDRVKPNIVFERNKAICNVQEDIKALGYLVGGKKDDVQATEGEVSNIFIKMHAGILVRLYDDDHTPMITGIEIMPNDHIVLCDHTNDRIKLFDRTGEFEGNLNMQSAPWDVAALHDNLVVITLPGIKQLQRIELFPKLKLLRSMQLDQGCYGW